MQRHPQWYYDLYDHIFAPARDYAREIALVSKHATLFDAIVEEIGSGTGHHVIEILKHRPKSVTAVDWDAIAIEILRARFRDSASVMVEFGDGFSSERAAEVIVAFYSVVQQASDFSSFESRLKQICGRLKALRAIAFLEVMDTEITREAYPPGRSNRVFVRGDEFVDITPSYRSDRLTVSYTGVIAGSPIRYDVSIVSCGIASLLGIAAAQGVNSSTVALEANRRRQLVVLDAR